MIRLYAPVITAQASSFRPGHACLLDLPDADGMRSGRMWGSYNVHLVMDFDDGVKWLLRVRLNDDGPKPAGFQQSIIRSEVATMRLLQEAGLAVPNAWLPVMTDTGVSGRYIFSKSVLC
jgi:hypothetical protein